MEIVKNKYDDLMSLGHVLVKCPPAKRIICQEEYDDEWGDVTNSKYFISIPQTIFRFNYRKVKFKRSDHFCLNTTSIAFLSNDKLYKAPFYNVDYTGGVCMGVSEIQYIKEFDKFVKYCVESFWKSSFSSDIDDNQFEYDSKKMTLGNCKKWQEKTKSDPEWIPDDEYLLYFPKEWEKNFKVKK